MKKVSEIILGCLFVLLFSCSMKTIETIDNNNKWITYHDTIDAGFILTFEYPEHITRADVIDNCRCVGEKVKNTNKNQGIDNTNTRQWCICMQDTSDYTVDYLVSSWKSVFKSQVVEKRDTITIDNTKALRIILKDKTKKASYRQLIYLKKYSTLFEIMNTHETTSNDFEIFYKSIRIKEYRKP